MTKKLLVFVVLVLGGIHAFTPTAQTNPGPIPFAPPVNYGAGEGPFYLFCADLDGDSDLDIAVSNLYSNDVSILKNTGYGTFHLGGSYDLGRSPAIVFCADLDRDADVDLAVGSYDDHYVSVLKNNGDGSFQPKEDYVVGQEAHCVFCADLNGDLALDLAVANASSDNVSILMNNGDGTFMPKVDYPTGDCPHWVFSADLDGDTDLDLATANWYGDNVSILRNNGNGTLQPAVNYPAGDNPHALFCADLDGDSDLDLAVANHWGGNISILKNDGDGTFESKADFGAVVAIHSVFCADLDADSDLDLATVGNPDLAPYSVAIMKNDGDAVFEQQANYIAGVSPQSVFCVDLDGDSDMDLAVANGGSDDVSILLNSSVVLGAICGPVTHDNGDPVANVTVKVIDSENNQVGAPIVTGSDGSFYFDGLLVGTYSVMIVTPLGYSVSPGETQTGIEVTGYPCTEVHFVLTPTITSNDCRTIGYWKHQFDVHLSGRGHAQEDSTDLEAYLDLVHLHFDVLGVYINLENFDFEDAKDVLTVRGGRLMEGRAKQQLFGLLLNFASARIGNETVISEDGRVAAEAVTYAALLINDGDAANDELAKNTCDLINSGQMLEGGIIPESSERYRVTQANGMPAEYALFQSYPNPFNPICEIAYALPSDCCVTLSIYNMLGQKVKVLVDEHQGAGYKSLKWDGKNDQGREVTSGVYFYRIRAGDFEHTNKMILVK